MQIATSRRGTAAMCPFSLHDALPISLRKPERDGRAIRRGEVGFDDLERRIVGIGVARSRESVREAGGENVPLGGHARVGGRSEEHTSALQSLTNLVCRVLLEKKKALR